MTEQKNLFKSVPLVSPDIRAERNIHEGAVFWFTGLSAAGKTTLAMRVEQKLFEKGYRTYVLDGDNIRLGLNTDLGFSSNDRTENIRRIGEVAALMADAGLICISAFISPYEMDRERARKASPEGFHEIYIKADIETCTKRDPKGLYKKAIKGEISDFTGISSPYEEPENADLIVDTMNHNIEDCVIKITGYIEENLKHRIIKKTP